MLRFLQPPCRLELSPPFHEALSEAERLPALSPSGQPAAGTTLGCSEELHA